MEVINKRRSVRNFTDQKIEPIKMMKLIKSAMQAPSAWNQQPWEFLVVEDTDKLKELANIHKFAKPLTRAAAAIIVLGNTEKLRSTYYIQQDLGACTQNILLEAVDQGLASVWLGVYPIEENVKFITEMYNLPENVFPFGIVVLGYPANEEDNTFVDRYDNSKVHFEKY